MIVDANLRQAIRAAERSQPSTSYEADRRAMQIAIARVVALPQHATKLKAARLRLERAQKIVDEAKAVFDELGISSDLDWIQNEAKFRKAGGRLNPKYQKWGSHRIIAELAAAKPSEAKKILARIGINWE